MENFRLFWSYPHCDYVDPVFHPGPTESRHPDQRRAPELLEFIEVDGSGWSAKAEVGSCLYFHKRDCLLPLNDQIQVPVPAPEPVLQHSPTPQAQPTGGDSFT
jgi:hypothetical protein